MKKGKKDVCDVKEEVNRRIDRKTAKTSLKKKIKLAMRTSSAITVLILSLLFAGVLYGGINLVTEIFVQHSANQLALQLTSQWSEEGWDEEAVAKLVNTVASKDFTEVMYQGPEGGPKSTDDPYIQHVLDNLIHYRVVLVETKGDLDIERVLYDTEMYDKNRIKDKDIRALSSKFVKSATAEFYDYKTMHMDHFEVEGDMVENLTTGDVAMDDNLLKDYKLGYVKATVNPVVSLVLFTLIIVFILLILLVNGVISSLLRFIFSGMITKPVAMIAKQLSAISEGDIETTLNQEIQVKRPVKEVQMMMNSTNAIIHKTKDYLETMEEQNYELEAQKEELIAQNSTLEERSTALTAMNDAYLSRTLNFQNLLDNVGQGFMTFGADLLVNPEYSLACEHMVDTSQGIEGRKITEVMGIEDSDKEFVEELLIKIFQSDREKKDLYTTLLPDEIQKEGHVFRVQYKHVSGIKGQAQMLVITTDITEQRLLESRVEEERNILQMIVKVMMNREEFVGLQKDLSDLAEFDFTGLDESMYEKVLRDIHTLKGSYAQYYLQNISRHLDQIEASVAEDKMDLKDVDGLAMMAAYKADLEVIKAYVGEDFFESADYYTVKEEKISDIEIKLKDLLPDNEFNKILPLIQSIRHKPIQSLLSGYVDYTSKLAERLGKSVDPVVITGDEVYVDNNVYADVFKSFTHLFRNAVDHGIEDEEERLMMDKESPAQVTCHIEDLVDHFKITIKDDGRGLDPDLLIEKAKAKGIYKGESGQETYQLLFKDGFSTRESASPISGRGVGLAAVKAAVEAIGGQIEVESELAKGTSFIVTLPLLSDTSLIAFSPDRLMDNVAEISQNYLKTLGIDLAINDQFKSNKISLKRVNALISIKGAVEGVMFFSANEALGRALMKGFVLEEVAEDQITDYIEDVLGEITNTVIGNVLGNLEAEGVYLTIGVPALISNKEAYMKYSETEIHVTDFKQGDYALSLNLLILDGSDERTLLTGR